MKPLYVLIRANGDFERTGGSSTAVRVKMYETLEKAERQAKRENTFYKRMIGYNTPNNDKMKEFYPVRVVIYRPSIVEVRNG